MKKFGIILASVLALPFSVGAQAITESVDDLNGIVQFIKGLLNTALPLIIAAAVVWFVWSMFQVFLAGDDDKKAKAKTNAIWGVVAIFIMVSVWGLVNILVNTFGLQNTAPTNATNPLNTVPGYNNIPSGGN